MKAQKFLLPLIILIATLLTNPMTSIAQNADFGIKQQKESIVKKRALKVDFLGPLFGHFTVGYEQWLKEKMTLETKLGIIGIGNDIEDNNAKGMYAKVGVKFLTGKDFYVPGMTSTHPLRGFYVKPELILSVFKSQDGYNYSDDGNNIEYNNISGSAMLNIGKQWILADILTFDMYTGVGYGFTNEKVTSGSATDRDSWYHSPRKYSHIQGPSEFPISWTAGLTLGILLK